MSLNDGYGNEVTADELVGNYRRWAHAVAGGFVSPSSLLYDDLVQESMIEIWKISMKKPDGVPATYLTQAAKYRMLAVVQGKPMTGGDSTPGPKSRPGEVAVDWQAADVEEIWGSLLAEADLLDAVDLAYHHGEIVEALNALPEADRAYVHQRFWQGMTDTEIAAARDASNKVLANRWKRTIKPQIQRSLAHLGAL